MDLQNPAHPVHWPAEKQVELLTAGAYEDGDPWDWAGWYRRYGAGWGRTQRARARRWKSWVRRRQAAGLPLRIARARWLGPITTIREELPYHLPPLLVEGVDFDEVVRCVRWYQVRFGALPTEVVLPCAQFDRWMTQIGPMMKVFLWPELSACAAFTEGGEPPGEERAVPTATMEVRCAERGELELSVRGFEGWGREVNQGRGSRPEGGR